MMTNRTKRNYFFNLIVVMVFTILVSCTSFSEKNNTVIPDTVAVYKGENNMGWVIAHYMIYPKSESKVNRAGKVYVSWTVNTLGDVENIKAEVKKDEESPQTIIARKLIKDQEVLEINKPVIDNLMYSIKLLEFIPAMKDGKPVNSELSTSVEFILVE